MDASHSPSSLLIAALLCLAWLHLATAMRPDRIAQLRQDTVEMFYHGFDNYMNLAFPEDEVCYLVQEAMELQRLQC